MMTKFHAVFINLTFPNINNNIRYSTHMVGISGGSGGLVEEVGAGE